MRQGRWLPSPLNLSQKMVKVGTQTLFLSHRSSRWEDGEPWEEPREGKPQKEVGGVAQGKAPEAARADLLLISIFLYGRPVAPQDWSGGGGVSVGLGRGAGSSWQRQSF